VKEQQDGIIAKLHTDCLALEDEINGLGLEVSVTLLKYHSSTSEDLMKIEDIPKEILDSDCPYPELKESLIRAFHSLSERYQCRLESLQQQLQRIDRFCGWCADDHHRFQFTLSQYTHDIPNHRVLYLDMIQRLFPQKTRQELVKHERVWDWQCFTQEQLRVVAQQWQRDHGELLARGLVTLEEARHAHYEELELHNDRQHQQDICSHLREKVRVSQTFTSGAVIVSTFNFTFYASNWATVLCLLAIFHFSRKQFYLKQKKRMEVVEQRDQERLASLRSMMEEQVYFIAKIIFSSLSQVVVQAMADPDRMMSHTEAWKSRQSNVHEFELQRPLYNINTYTDTQIVSDPRVRVEQALREAGLHHSQYAREVLSVIKPPKPPRRDTIHNQ
uniref:Coiled-coil domain containing 148 n=1 Tax=Mola mola TaxID=94237 RepID=A0A3Q3VZW5_MOLML